MSARHHHPAPSRCLQVAPRSRGGWVVMSGRAGVVSEHTTATEAEQAALARLRDGDELIVYDCYHRSHRVRRAAKRSHDA